MIELTRISDYYYVKRVKKNEERKGVRKKSATRERRREERFKEGDRCFFTILSLTNYTFFIL